MAFITGSRNQLSLLPLSIEDYIDKLNPVRAFDAFVESLDFNKLNIQLTDFLSGQKAYEPKTMLKVILYGYSYGWRSSRKLERALHNDLSFIWLTGGLKPNFRTICRFRNENIEILKKVMFQCVDICVELDLIEGNTLFLDGSKFRANASINQTKIRKNLEDKLDRTKKRIDEIFQECQKADEDEAEDGSYVEMPAEYKDIVLLKDKIEKILARFKGKEKLNLTDEDSVNMKGRQGIHACYNAQAVVDEKNGLIVNVDVVNENNDLKQFSNQIQAANEVLGKDCEIACADGGYSNTDNLKETLDKGILVVVPNQKQSNSKHIESPYSKEKFIFDEELNCYYCPEGKKLHYSHYVIFKNHYCYRIANSSDCVNCVHFGKNKCTCCKRGRTINRLANEKTKKELEAIYASEKGQEAYKKRKSKVELPFGHIKRNLNGGHFLLRGLNAAKGEMSILCTCFNIARMITLTGGVSSFIGALS